MKFKTNLAYSKSNLQRVKQNQNRLFKKVHIGRIQRNRVRLRLKFYIFSIVFAAAFLSVFILSLVKCNEITASLNSVKKKLQIQTSENIRLKTQLEQKMNIQKIEKYAKENLGMKHLDNQQINYIKINSAVEAEANKSFNNSKTKQNFFSNLLNKIKKTFHLES